MWQYDPEYGSAITDYIISLCAESKNQEILEYTNAYEIPKLGEGVIPDILGLAMNPLPLGKNIRPDTINN